MACWGANDAAQLGNGASVDSDPHPTPQDAAGLTNVVAIELRFQTGFAIDGSAHVWAWGLDDVAQLGHAPGDGDATCRDGPCREAASRLAGLP